MPVRCFTCNKVVCNKLSAYQTYCQTISTEEALNRIGMDRYCCRRMFITHIDTSQQQIDFKNSLPDTTDPYIREKTKAVAKEKRTYLAR